MWPYTHKEWEEEEDLMRTTSCEEVLQNRQSQLTKKETPGRKRKESEKGFRGGETYDQQRKWVYNVKCEVYGTLNKYKEMLVAKNRRGVEEENNRRGVEEENKEQLKAQETKEEEIRKKGAQAHVE